MPLCLQGHGRPVDWWALGVLLFEMVAGCPPFYDKDLAATYRRILWGRVAFPGHTSVVCRDLIRRLLHVRRDATAPPAAGHFSHVQHCLERKANLRSGAGLF